MISRYGELLVACRDSEERVRFLGYDPANVKTVAYVVAAVLAGIAGALFVLDRRHHLARRRRHRAVDQHADRGRDRRPDHAARPGARHHRRRLDGNQSVANSSRPFWIYFQGALFMLVVAFLPGGLASPVVGDPVAAQGAGRDGRRRPNPTRAGRRRRSSDGAGSGRSGRGAADGDRLPRGPRAARGFRRLRRRRQRRPDRAEGRPALPHRAQRRRQDDAGGRGQRPGAVHRLTSSSPASSCPARRCTRSPEWASGAPSRRPPCSRS